MGRRNLDPFPRPDRESSEEELDRDEHHHHDGRFTQPSITRVRPEHVYPADDHREPRKECACSVGKMYPDLRGLHRREIIELCPLFVDP